MDLLNKFMKMFLFFIIVVFFFIVSYRLFYVDNIDPIINDIIQEREKELEKIENENIDLYIRIDDFLRLHEPKSRI